jgi:pimeloyl-ACP methyl ester carboxylesterase
MIEQAAARARRVWTEVLGGRLLGRPRLVDVSTPARGDEAPAVHAPAIVPMPEANVRGPGRNRAFRLPQFFATVNGLRTAFCDAGRGPPLVFVHGLAGDVTHWVHVASRFVDRCRVVGLDLPACGESELPGGPLSVDLCVRQLDGLLDLLGIHAATIVGHSLGGMVATELALARPRRVARLVLIDPAGFQRMSFPLRAAGHLFLRPFILSRLLPPLWKGVLDLVFREKNELTRGFVRSIEETYRVEDIHGIAAVIAGLRGEFLDRDYLASLDRLAVPTLLVWGGKDLLTPASALRETARRMPNVVAHEIPDCGHMPIIERPEEIVRLIAGQLGG